MSMLAATQAQSTVTAEGLLMQCLAVAAHLTKLSALHLSPRRCLQAVQVIHAARIVHADLKPANFLVVEGQLKLIDFGIAKAIQGDTTSISRESQVRLGLCCCLRPLNQRSGPRQQSSQLVDGLEEGCQRGGPPHAAWQTATAAAQQRGGVQGRLCACQTWDHQVNARAWCIGGHAQLHGARDHLEWARQRLQWRPACQGGSQHG